MKSFLGRSAPVGVVTNRALEPVIAVVGDNTNNGQKI